MAELEKAEGLTEGAEEKEVVFRQGCSRAEIP